MGYGRCEYMACCNWAELLLFIGGNWVGLGSSWTWYELRLLMTSYALIVSSKNVRRVYTVNKITGKKLQAAATFAGNRKKARNPALI